MSAADDWKRRWIGIERVTRLSRQIYCPDLPTAIAGAGGLYCDGRWHRKGQPVVYAASSRALCVLERMVHLDAGIYDASLDLVFLALSLPGEATRLALDPATLDDLAARDATVRSEPLDWRTRDHPLCRRIGSAWLSAGLSALLIVPSAVLPQEANVLINPRHADMAKILAANAGTFATEPYQGDRRLADIIALAAKGHGA